MEEKVFEAGDVIIEEGRKRRCSETFSDCSDLWRTDALNNERKTRRESDSATLLSPSTGDDGDYFYVIESGTVECFKGERKVMYRKSGGKLLPSPWSY